MSEYCGREGKIGLEVGLPVVIDVGGGREPVEFEGLVLDGVGT